MVLPRNEQTERRLARARRALLSIVMASAVGLVFVEADWLSLGGAGALIAYLTLGWRQFGFGTWVPVIMAVGVFLVALDQGMPATVLMTGLDRMLLLSAMIAVLGSLRSAAALAREVKQAGAYVTAQPASRRYLALTFGGHIFGVLINFGGLALLLDLAKRSLDTEEARQQSPEIQEAKLRRMTLAILRGFTLIALWSPLGFATNTIIVSMPGLSYFDFGPIGFALSFMLVAIGWMVDRIEGRRYRNMAPPHVAPPPGSALGAVVLLGHVVLLGSLVFLLYGFSALTFQQALILVVPVYALAWAAASGIGAADGPSGALATGLRSAWERLSNMAGEIGVFAAAGFASVVLPLLIPMEALRTLVAELALGPMVLAPGLSVAILVLACIGVNPIVTASVLGATASHLDVPGLGDPLIALSIIGGWTAVMGLSPFITTVIYCATIIRRTPSRIGLVWNSPYCLAAFVSWWLVLSGLIAMGVL